MQVQTIKFQKPVFKHNSRSKSSSSQINTKLEGSWTYFENSSQKNHTNCNTHIFKIKYNDSFDIFFSQLLFLWLKFYCLQIMTCTLEHILLTLHSYFFIFYLWLKFIFYELRFVGGKLACSSRSNSSLISSHIYKLYLQM